LGFFLRLDDGDVVGQWAFWSNLSGCVPWKHDLDLDTQHTLTQKNVTGGCVDVVVARVTRVNHQAIDELHRLGTLTTELSGNDNFATLGSRFHDETENTIASTTDGQSSDKFVAERFSLGDGAKTAGGDLFSVQFNCSWSEVESKIENYNETLIFNSVHAMHSPLLDDSGQFTNATSLFSENVLCSGGHDDDFSAGWCNTDLNTGVTIFGELASQELIQFGFEDASGDELKI
jgi:hypothetical protein